MKKSPGLKEEPLLIFLLLLPFPLPLVTVTVTVLTRFQQVVSLNPKPCIFAADKGARAAVRCVLQLQRNTRVVHHEVDLIALQLL